MKRFESFDGVGERRREPQQVLWDHQRVIGCGGVVLHDRREDAATVRALANMLHTVKMRRGQGLVFALVNNDDTMDLGFTGKLYSNPVLATWAVDQLLRLLEHLPDHPEGRNWEDVLQR